MLGSEDAAIVRPAVEALRAAGIDATGPLPADTMFHAGSARKTYDAALCMYHDQALIPIKTLAFDEGVNVTLGLPFVRTSPDHGTALRSPARARRAPTSLIAALRLADALARSDERGLSERDALEALPPLREVIAAHGLSARKALGQNFLLDLNLTRRIARAGGPLAGSHVVEIGPGPGRTDARAARSRAPAASRRSSATAARCRRSQRSPPPRPAG